MMGMSGVAITNIKSLSPIFWDCLTITVLDITRPKSAANPIGHINFLMKLTGKPNVGNPHVGFDEAGGGNGLWVPRQLSTIPGEGSG